MTALGGWLGTRGRVKLRVEGPDGVVDIDARAGRATTQMLEQACAVTGLAPRAPDAPA